MIAVIVAAVAGATGGVAFGELLIVRAVRHGARAAASGPVAIGPVRGRRIDPRWLGALLDLGRRIGQGVGGRLPPPTSAAERLEAAGLTPAITVTDLAAARGAGTIVGVGAMVVLTPVAGVEALVLAGAVPIALLLLPDLLIGRRIRERAGAMLVELPDTIDLLRIVLRSGRSVPETLARVGAHRPGPLGDELRRTAAEIRLGAETEQALVLLRRRCPAEGASELVAQLLRCHRHGTDAGDGLRALADDLRARRSRAAIDRAARAAPKIQLVVALLLVPAAMLLIAAALLQMRDDRPGHAGPVGPLAPHDRGERAVERV